jgi:hypothetical protein
MWNLVLRNFSSHMVGDPTFMSVVTQEFLMALFWEETQFANIRQHRFTHDDWLKRWTQPTAAKHNPNGNHAVGFGQVERESIVLFRALRRSMGPLGQIPVQEIDLEVLADENKSVEISWRALHALWQSGKFTTAAGLMRGYGGKPNYGKVPGIVNSAAILHGFSHPAAKRPTSAGPELNFRLLAGACWIARHNGAFARAFGIGQTEAARTGTELQRIVVKNGQRSTLNPRVQAELERYIASAAT